MIISACNYTWFILLLLAVAYTFFTTKYNKDKTDEEKLNFLKKQSIIICIVWILYKIGLALDEEYLEFEFWNEWPFYPCNTVLWLAIIGCVKNNKTIMAYSFYAGVLFAIMAMLMPSPGFYDISVFTVRALGYYVTHWFVVIIGLQFATFGLFKVSIKSSVMAGVCFLVIAAVMHLLNILLRATVYPEASYYFTFGNEDNSVLTMVHDAIPLNYFYLVPLVVFGVLVFMLETVIINSTGRLIRRCKDRS